MPSNDWIGVDLDGTLAVHDKDGDAFHVLYIGEPIWPMVERVKQWIAEGKTVRVVTARANPKEYMKGAEAFDMDRYNQVIGAVKAWTLKYVGYELEVTCAKDRFMTELWDDRAVQVEKNVGEPTTYWTSIHGN
jgi:hypothetical protein